jgi:D-alanyl-D-alanine carboxypeptidase/D-alanyl-D-alanine-endopeptidase (penicillin-binding protein 4)
MRFLPALATLLCIAVAAHADDNAIRAAIQKELTNPAIAHGWTGVHIKSLADHRVVFSQNADKMFIPASNMKMLVSSCAVDTLPPNFTYATPVMREGTVTNGVLKGNLYLKGSGDSTMEAKDLRVLAKAVRAAGISRVDGDNVGDGSIFDHKLIPSSWTWDDLGYYYSAQVDGLTVDRGTVHVRVTPGEVGQPPVVSLEPDAGYMLIRNTAKTVADSAPETLDVDRVRAANIITVSGNIRRGNKESLQDITMEEPAVYTASLFRKLLDEEGVFVTGVARRGETPGGLPILATYTSPDLPGILKLIMKPSDNLMAESLLKSIGAVAGGAGSTAAGASVELSYLKKIGVDPAEVFIVDGSGLARRNMISPESLVSVLSYMYSHPNGKMWIDSLPVAGVDGTLRSRMKGTSGEGKVRAKTGFVGKARTLSGYATAKDGEVYAFSLMMNHYNGETSAINEIQNRICEILTSSSR